LENRRPPHFLLPADKLLWEILEQQRRSYEQQRITNSLLYRLLQIEEPKTKSLTITQTGATMQQFDPGAIGIVLQAAFTPAGATAPNAGFTVAWTDSNNFATFANDASDATGLTQDVTLASTATVGTSGVITATLTGTFPDGTAANLTGTFNYTIGAAPVGNATGLGITQTA
jgi:hypothetical protein